MQLKKYIYKKIYILHTQHPNPVQYVLAEDGLNAIFLSYKTFYFKLFLLIQYQ